MAGKIVRRSMFELRYMQLYFKIITEEKKSHHEEKRLHTVTIYLKATTTDCQVDKMGKINYNKDVWCINFDFLFNKNVHASKELYFKGRRNTRTRTLSISLLSLIFSLFAWNYFVLVVGHLLDFI